MEPLEKADDALASPKDTDLEDTDSDEVVLTVDAFNNVIVDSVTTLTENRFYPESIMCQDALGVAEEQGERLTLAYERLYEIPRTIVERFPDVKHLDISHNKIMNLDPLVHFKQLTSLIADDNPLTEDCILPPLPNLNLLWLNHCKISSLFPWVRKLRQSCPNVKYLCLMGNPAAPSYLNGGTFYEYLQYRLFVISQFPSLVHLDDRAVTDDQRAEAHRLYKRPLFERLALKGSGFTDIVNKSPSWNFIKNNMWSLKKEDKAGRNLFI